MKESNRNRKSEIKYNITLNDEQKHAKQLIIDNQVVVITGKAGSGKTSIGAITALDFLNKKECNQILVTRAAIEVGKSLGYLPGELNQKFNPYIEAIIDNLYKCTDRERIDNFVKDNKIQGMPVQYIRGKTIDDVLIIDESQNLTKHEMLAILTRLGKTGKMIVLGDNEQKDINNSYTGLNYVIDLSKQIDEIKWVKLKENHRSDLVGKILNYEYNS